MQRSLAFLILVMLLSACGATAPAGTEPSVAIPTGEPLASGHVGGSPSPSGDQPLLAERPIAPGMYAVPPGPYGWPPAQCRHPPPTGCPPDPPHAASKLMELAVAGDGRPWEPGVFARGPSSIWRGWALDVDGLRVVLLVGEFAGRPAER